jgi:hypothetical protein
MKILALERELLTSKVLVNNLPQAVEDHLTMSPSVKEGIVTFEFIPLKPFSGIERFFR